MKRAVATITESYVLPENFNSQAARRSMTPQGFAIQFYKANK